MIIVKNEINPWSQTARQILVDLPKIRFFALSREIIKAEVDVNIVPYVTRRVVGMQLVLSLHDVRIQFPEGNPSSNRSDIARTVLSLRGVNFLL